MSASHQMRCVWKKLHSSATTIFSWKTIHRCVPRGQRLSDRGAVSWCGGGAVPLFVHTSKVHHGWWANWAGILTVVKDFDRKNLNLGPEVLVQDWKREEGCLEKENRYCTGCCAQRRDHFWLWSSQNCIDWLIGNKLTWLSIYPMDSSRGHLEIVSLRGQTSLPAVGSAMPDIWRLHWSLAPSELSFEYFLGCKLSCLLKYK